MELRDYLGLARRRSLMIAAIALCGVSLAALATLLMQPQYQARTSILFAVQGAASASDLAQGSTYAEKQVQSYAEVAASPLVLDPVIRRLQLNSTPAELARRVTTTVPQKTVIVEVTVTDPDAASAARIANAIGDQVAETVRELSPKRDGQDTVKATTISPALPPPSPSSPKVAQNLALGLLLGLALGFAAALVRERLDTRVRNEADVAAVTTASQVGSIPYVAGTPEHPLELGAHTDQRFEAYRRLRTNVQFVAAPQGRTALVVTSSVPGEGKSVTVANLALAMADAGNRTLLIDADMRRPTVADNFGLVGTAGLSTILAGQATLSDLVQPFSGHPDLYVLTSGVVPPNPTELLDSAQMRALLDEALAEYDVVLIDSPPLLPVSDGLVLGKLVGGALLVTGIERVKKPQLAESLAALETVDVKVQGVVLNMVRRKERGDAYGYYAYGSEPGRQRSSSAATGRRAAPSGERPDDLVLTPRQARE
ncbi:tyrosine-protein kinase domain-containing protein [Enemella evansiae]|uniref:polysaccharide biosynthesis tyrosine autokinase n=1 Tax=Enemella evansiae TaxID=2016499 RepID=UPI0015C6860F|nr:polysaccharide biosynthesis tyrosine autokinase [Enemella evansiae]